jgi:hypothetical protein
MRVPQRSQAPAGQSGLRRTILIILFLIIRSLHRTTKDPHREIEVA